MIVCSLITSYSCKILIASAQTTHSTTYEYLGLRAVGKNKINFILLKWIIFKKIIGRSMKLIVELRLFD